MRIRSIEPQRGRQVRLTFDNGETCLLDRQTVEESPYCAGENIDEEQLTAITAASDTRRAREYALYLLSLRDYGEGELRRKLREKGYGGAAEDTVLHMRELGLLNDEVYAARRARDCRLYKLYSRRRTVQELCARGLPRIVAEAAVDAVDADENLTDEQQALALLQKKRYNGSTTEEQRRRGTQMLLRNGYDSHAIREAWQMLADGMAADDGFYFTE